MKRGAFQVRYLVPAWMMPIVKADLVAAFELWREGRSGPIKIRATVWGERLTDDQIRERLRGRQLRYRPGRVERYAEPDITMCDYDRRRTPELVRLFRLARQFGIAPLWIEDRRTVHGWHRVIKWNRKFRPMEIISLQLLMGSDRAREAYNFQRAMTGTSSNRWNLLYTYKL